MLLILALAHAAVIGPKTFEDHWSAKNVLADETEQQTERVLSNLRGSVVDGPLKRTTSREKGCVVYLLTYGDDKEQMMVSEQHIFAHSFVT